MKTAAICKTTKLQKSFLKKTPEIYICQENVLWKNRIMEEMNLFFKLKIILYSLICREISKENLLKNLK